MTAPRFFTDEDVYGEVARLYVAPESTLYLRRKQHVMG